MRIVLLLLINAFTVGEEVELSPDDIISAAFHRPLLEIIYPNNGEVLDTSEIDIEIASNDYVMPSRFRDSKVCVGMNAMRGVENGIEGNVVERCFDQTQSTTFHASGLIAGASYTLRVLLMDRGNVVAVSVRSFRVAAIALHDSKVTIKTALEAAVSHHRLAEMDQAAAIYTLILKENPSHQDALHLMGLVLYQNGNARDAIPYIERAINTNSTFQDFHNSLGLCLRAVGNVREAVSQFELALTIKTDFLEAAFNLGLSWQQLNEWDRATSLYTKVVRDSFGLKEHPVSIHVVDKLALEAQLRLCDLLQGLMRWNEALQCTQEALERWPKNAQFYHEKGTVELHLGDMENSVKSFQSASALGMEVAEINIAMIFEIVGETDKSIEQYNKVLQNKLDNGAPHGYILLMKATVLPRILPGSAEEIQAARQKFESGIDELLPIISEYSDMTEPLSIAFSLGFYLTFHKSSNREIKQKLAHVYTLYCPALETGEFLGEDNVILQSHLVLKEPHNPLVDGKGQSRIRVGFVSRFLYYHAIGTIIKDLLLQFDRSKFEVFIFAISPKKPDSVSSALERLAEHYVVLPDNLRLCHQRIVSRGIDIIVYPEISTDPVTYFLSFSRMAPVQAAWWGHPDTSGIPTIDYFLSSEYEHEDAETHYTEKLVRMRGMGVYYTAPTLPVDAFTKEDVRAGIARSLIIPTMFHMYMSTQPLINFHPDFDQALKRILDSDPLGHVFLTGTTQRSYWIDRLQRRFASKMKKAAQRIHFIRDKTDDELLVLLNAADVVLDSIYCGTPVASLHAIAVGTPIITLPGVHWRSRITYGFYKQLGVLDCVAKSISDYAHLALRVVFDENFRNEVSLKLLSNSNKIFQDKTAVDEWEKFFVESLATRNKSNRDDDPLELPIAT